MDAEQKKQTIHMLPKGKATTKFREQHKRSTQKKPANTNGVSEFIEKQLDAVLVVRLKGITNPKLRKVIEECVREEALKKLAKNKLGKTTPGEVVRAVEASIAEINKSIGAVVPGRPVSPTPSPSTYGGKYSPGTGGKSSPSTGGKISPGSGGKSGGKSSPPPPPPRSRGNGGKTSTRYGGK